MTHDELHKLIKIAKWVYLPVITENGIHYTRVRKIDVYGSLSSFVGMCGELYPSGELYIGRSHGQSE